MSTRVLRERHRVLIQASSGKWRRASATQVDSAIWTSERPTQVLKMNSETLGVLERPLSKLASGSDTAANATRPMSHCNKQLGRSDISMHPHHCGVRRCFVCNTDADLVCAQCKRIFHARCANVTWTRRPQFQCVASPLSSNKL